MQSNGPQQQVDDNDTSITRGSTQQYKSWNALQNGEDLDDFFAGIYEQCSRRERTPVEDTIYPHDHVCSLPGAGEFPLWRIRCRVCLSLMSRTKSFSSLLGGPGGRGCLFPSPESDQRQASNMIGLYLWFGPRLNLCRRYFGCRYDLPSQFNTWNHSEAIWHCTPVN